MPLSPSVVELVHHVELNDSRWWEGACENAVLGILWLAEGRLPLDEIRLELGNLGLEIDAHRVEIALEQLSERNLARPTGNHDYELTEAGRSSITERVSGGEALENDARQLFERVASKHSQHELPIEGLWQSFNETLLLPMIQDLGAATYELLRGDSFGFDPGGYLDQFTSTHPELDAELMAAATAEFLDPSIEIVRRYILRNLSASFTIRAAGLDEVTLKTIREATQTPAIFDCFLDTNVLFSALKLHDNPANEAAEHLLTVAQQSDRAQVTFRVLPITLQEAKSALIRAQDYCRGLVLKGSLASAANNVPMGGLAAQFVHQATQGGIRDAETYFGEIIDNLLQLCRNMGIELHNEDLDAYKVREDVVTDLMANLEFERSGRHHPKSYEQVEHDVTIWHYVRDRRPAYVESPLLARYWISTVDYRFIGFDSHKTRRNRQVPACIDPNALLQLLQFWVPRSEEMERAFVASLRVAFLFHDFDLEAERAVIKILRTLSRFEGSEHLSEESVTSMVLNGELRRRMESTDDAATEVSLIRDEFVAIEEHLRRDLDSTRERLLEREKRGLSAESELETKESELSSLQDYVAELEAAVHETRSDRDKTSQQAIDRESSAMKTYLVWASLAISLLLLIAVGLGLTFIPRASFLVAIIFGLLASGVWILGARRRLASMSSATQNKYSWVSGWNRMWLAVVVGVATSLGGALAYSELVGLLR